MVQQGRGQPATGRLDYVDGLRGYLIFAMTVGHVAVITQYPGLNFLTHKPFAVFLTGEGFMAVSGFVTGYILTLRNGRPDAPNGVAWGMKRAAYIALHYLLVFALCALPSLIWPLDGTLASSLFHGRTDFVLSDVVLLASGLFRPAFFDILWLYILFIALAPAVLIALRSWSGLLVLTLSFLAWLFTQYGLTGRAIELVVQQVPGAQWPETGAFHIFAWQALFFGSLALGQLYARKPQTVRKMLNGVGAAFPYILAGLASFAVLGVLRMAGVLGQSYMEDYLTLGVMPVINMVLAVVALWYIMAANRMQGTHAQRVLHALLSAGVFRSIGRVTLQSFACSIVLSYWAAYWVAPGAGMPLWQALGICAAVMTGVYVLARVICQWHQTAAGAALRQVRSAAE